MQHRDEDDVEVAAVGYFEGGEEIENAGVQTGTREKCKSKRASERREDSVVAARKKTIEDEQRGKRELGGAPWELAAFYCFSEGRPSGRSRRRRIGRR